MIKPFFPIATPAGHPVVKVDAWVKEVQVSDV